ncbi:L-dopachrome tautomerase-related protein [Methylorubrum sp. SL192]|uniref:L-dopachrome tautomerase-related protein n=1 Tax=Methylorubrum sp. SL192 TaxID=2995167 RepID=UPI002275CAAE|nr:L-dopachrome tautomerase-related protein [Methylorubrum sp. SL192]MCY1641061.1 VOC family protein [Methylorubrum sp. SL192]
MSMTTAPEARAASAQTPVLTVAAQSRWLCNGVAAAPDGTLFLGLPRFPDHTETPSLVRVEPDGALSPFPGGTWNAWSQGKDGRDAFVMVNAVHVFNDGTLWVVDQGTVAGRAVPGAQKIVRLDPRTGTVLAVLRFGDSILPAGATMNDLRLHDHMLYVTDSGLGGIIVHDLAANRTLRRLSGHPLLRKPDGAAQKGQAGRVLADAAGRRPAVASDMIELDADGAWLYWATPTGPVRRIATALLADETLTDAELAAAIQTIAEIPTISGTAMDTLGNLYLSDAENRRIAVLTPQGRMLTLVQDDRLASPDALFIDGQRRLCIPASQLENLAANTGGDDRTRAPWQVLSLPLPRELAGIRLGDAVTGRPPSRGLSDIYGIEHVAMTVPDMEAAIRFLEQAFGATLLYRHLKLTDQPLTAADVGRINGLPETATMRGACQMRLGNGANIELFQLTGIGRTEAAGINDIGLNHFSMVVDDIAQATKRFAAAGGTLLEGPNDLGLNETGAGNQLWFGRMPWGTWVEFMTFRSPLRYDAGATQERRFPARG